MSLHCLVYTSVGTKQFSESHLQALLIKCRCNNEKLNISGLLLYLDPFFIQILEGDDDILKSLFDKIKMDARHEKVRIMYHKPIEARSFASWTMGFHRTNYQELESIDGFSDFWQRQTSDLFSNPSNETEKILQNLIAKFKNEILF